MLEYLYVCIGWFQATFEKIESELREVNTNAEALKRNYLELIELREVLMKTQNFFREVIYICTKVSDRNKLNHLTI